jgi:hypothetical protein
MAIEHHTKALSLDSKHVYQALPRLLSLWFDFTSIIAKEQIISERYSASGCKRECFRFGVENVADFSSF